MPPAGRTLDAAESLLVKCRPLSTQWGRERFGLVNTSVLQALEVSLRQGAGVWGGWVLVGLLRCSSRSAARTAPCIPLNMLYLHACPMGLSVPSAGPARR